MKDLNELHDALVARRRARRLRMRRLAELPPRLWRDAGLPGHGTGPGRRQMPEIAALRLPPV
ncbi:hypothetical protein [Mangrovicoccus sp. HB161399]|uniref:hypothetical protein n=1 Tax=Mangrovicoccus sp. HB161399 TaxID=2720392 RepID=UPI00155775DA|nr:hypothetical protein [Mangrovicoccus sp. HB161399]